MAHARPNRLLRRPCSLACSASSPPGRKALIWLEAWVRALTALRRVSSSSRSSPAKPRRSLGAAVGLRPASTVRGGISRHRPGRFCPLRRRRDRSGQLISQTCTPASASSRDSRCPVAAGAFHPGIGDRAQPGQPPHQLGVPGVGGGEAPHRQPPSQPVQHHNNVHILVHAGPQRHQRHTPSRSAVKEPQRPGQDTHDARAGNAPTGSPGHAEAGAGTRQADQCEGIRPAELRVRP